MRARRLGFSAVVGHDDLKLALLLAAIDPGIGGVLLRGDKGSGKTTLARGLAALLPGDAPFVELPLGTTEDRALGSIDLASALATGQERVRRGLLADADGGVLYVDEVNLLADHLVDTLLDVAVSGEHRLERDGVSVVQPARFVLVGTMNPEEGELRPQLLDRFGLCVTVTAPDDPLVRAEIVRRRLAFDRAAGNRAAFDRAAGDRAAGDRAVAGDGPGPGDVGPGDAGPDPDDADPDDLALRQRLAATRPAGLGEAALAFATHLALAVGAEGVRADLVLCRAAAALAGWEGRPAAEVADVERVAPVVLAHRRRRSPFDPPVLPPDELADAVERARHASGEAARTPAPNGGSPAHEPPSAPPPADGDHPPGGGPASPSTGGARAQAPSAGPPAPPAPPDGDSNPGAPPPDGRPSPGSPGAPPGPADPTDGRPRGGAPGSPPPSGRPGPADTPGQAHPAPWGAARAVPVLPGPAPGAPAHGGSGATGGGGRPQGPRQGGSPATTPGGARGRQVRDEPYDPGAGRPVAVTASVRTFAQRRAIDPAARPEPRDLRAGVRQDRPGTLVVIALDTSGSMGARHRVEAATGAVLGLLTDAYQRRDRVAVVTFDGQGARVALAPTSSVEVARTRLADLHTGGTTPLAAGLRTALDLAVRQPGVGARGHAVLVVVTDGRATGPGAGAAAHPVTADPLAAALEAGRAVRAAGVPALVLDAETGTPRLGLATRLAEAMGAPCQPLASLPAALHTLTAP
jgi:magnesium chelatase subunit D